MAIKWPLATSIGQTYTYGNNTWRWDGEAWNSLGAYIPGPTGNTGPSGPTGATGASIQGPTHTLEQVLQYGNISGLNNIILTTDQKITGASASNNYIYLGQTGSINNISIGTELNNKVTKIQFKDDGYMLFNYGPINTSNMCKYYSSASLMKDTLGTQTIATLSNFPDTNRAISVKAWFIANYTYRISDEITKAYTAEIFSLFSETPGITYTLSKMESSIIETSNFFGNVNIRTDGTNIILEVNQTVASGVSWKVFYEYVVGYHSPAALYE